MSQNSFIIQGDRESLMKKLQYLKQKYNLDYNEEFKEGNLEDENARVNKQLDQINQALKQQDLTKKEKKRNKAIKKNLFLQQSVLHQIENIDLGSDSDGEFTITFSKQSDSDDQSDKSDNDELPINTEDIEFAQSMPECFEKSIIEIQYMIELLVQEKPDDRVFGLKDQDQIIQKIQKRLQDAYNQMNDERISYNVVLKLNDLKKLFENPRAKKKNNISQGRTSITKVLQEIRIFNFSSFFALVKINDNNSQSLKNKDIIAVLGTTGSGKSTTIQYLFGAEIKSINNHFQSDPNDYPQLKNFIASEALRSVTRNINHIQIETKNSKNETIKLFLVDTPGYDDTHGAEADASNTLGVVKAIQNARKVYPVLMFTFQDIGGRWQQIQQQLKFYSQMIKNINLVSFFFTKWPKDQQMNKQIKSGLNQLSENDPQLQNAWNVLYQQSIKGHIRILDPLDKKGEDMIKHILRQNPIINPSQNFKLILMPSTSQKINTQVEKHIYLITECLEKLEADSIFELLKFKINELKKLSQIFIQFEINNYQEKLEQVKGTLTQKQDQMKNSLNILAQKFLSQGQQLLAEDIAKIQKYIALDQKIGSLLQIIIQEEQPNGMIDKNISQCEALKTIIAQSNSKVDFLFNEADVSDRQWYEYMIKAKELSKIKGCENLERNVIEMYTQKLNSTAERAINALKETQISKYCQQNPVNRPEEEKKERQNNQLRQEKIPNQKNLHEIFAISLQTVINAQNKAEEFKMNYLSNEIQKEYLRKIQGSLNQLDNLAQPHFQSLTKELKYAINKDNINDINLVFMMLNSYYKSCVTISQPFANIISEILKSYTEKTVEAFKFQKTEIFRIMQIDDPEKPKKIKEHNDQIYLLSEISQIKIETELWFKETQTLIQNKEALKKIVEIVKDLANFIIDDVQENYQMLIETKAQKIKNLNEALKSLEITAISYSHDKLFRSNAIGPIKDAFKELYIKICKECKYYLSSIEQDPQNLPYIAYLNDFLQEIFEIASSIKIESDLQKDEKQNFLIILQNYIQNIISKFESVQNRLMTLNDFRNFQNYLKFLKHFINAGGQVPQTYKNLLIDINKNDGFQSQKNPKQIILLLSQSLQMQFQIIQKEFDANLLILLNVSSGYNQNLLLEDQIKKIEEIANNIVLLFRLENSLKKMQTVIGYNNADNFQNQNLEAKIINKFFIDLDLQTIQGQNRIWIYLKFKSMIILQELDEFIPNQLASTCLANLKKEYQSNQGVEVEKAKKQFDEEKFQEMSDELQELQKLIQDRHAADIFDKIIKYINFQTESTFDTLCGKKYANNQKLTEETAFSIFKDTEYLLKIKAHFDQFIKIRSKNIQERLNAEIFEYLDEQFKMQIEVIDRLMKQDFLKCQQKIDIMRNIFTKKALYLYNQLSNQQDQRIRKFTEDINQKQNLLLDEIQKNLDIILKRNFDESDRKPFAHQIYNQISNKNQRESFLKQLSDKYENKLIELIETMSKTQIPKEIEKIKQEADSINKCQQYMPDLVKTIIKEQFTLLSEKYILKFQLIEKTVKQQLDKKINPIKLSIEYLENFQIDQMDNQLQIDIKSYLIKYIDKNINENVQKSLQNKNIYELFESMQLLLSYKNDKKLSEFINDELSTQYSNILSEIKQMFNEAIIDISCYFQKTHGNNGDPISLQILQNKRQRPEISLQVIMNIFNLRKDHEAIIKNQMPDYINQFKELIDNAIKYLRNMKDQHQQIKKHGHLYESVSILGNLKFTDQINQDGKFNQFLKETRNKYQHKIDELIRECEITSFKKFQEEVISNINQQVELNLKQKILELKRSSQKDIDAFIKVYYYNYDSIKKAYEAGQKSEFNYNSSISKTYQTIKEEIFQQTNLALQNMCKINETIKTGGKILKEQFEHFDFLTKSFYSMEREFLDFRNEIQEIIRRTKEAINQRLLDLERQCQEYQYQDQFQIHMVSLNLCSIQEMSENMSIYQEEIKKLLDKIIEDYSQKTSRDPNSNSSLYSHLLGINGSYGKTIAQQHPYFKGANIFQRNKKFDGKNINQVMMEIKGEGNDLNQQGILLLKEYYDDFYPVFFDIIKEKLIPRYDSNNNRLPLEISDIINTIKQTLTDSQLRQWKESQIQEKIQMPDKKKRYKLSVLLGNIFALWALINSQDYLKQENGAELNENNKNYLLRPHIAQIFSILRILGVGYSSPYRNGQKFNENWKNLFGNPSAIRNNLVQIKTGEGKSVVLAATSMVLALNGFEISCACYSKYLSERDYEDFQPMFRELGIQNMIKYGTFNELAELQLNREGDIRDIVKWLVLKDQFIQKRPIINLKEDIPPQVLLIDEVDYFFTKSFFGEIYIPAVQIKHQAISDLCDYIWNFNKERIKQLKDMSSEDQQKQNSNPYMSLKNLKETQEYRNAKEIFKSEYQFLVEEAASRMIVDVIEYEKQEDKYVIQDGKIGYEEQDLISTNITVRYQTLFAYYLNHGLGKISKDDLTQQKSILLDCALQSFAEVPLQYDIILGMTGTLDTLSETQKWIIKNKYCIEHKTFSPPVYTNDTVDIFNVNQGTKIIVNPPEYYQRLTQQIIPNYYDKKRPIILFFENNQALETCLDSNCFENFKYQIINERDSKKEKQNKVLKATQEYQITLTTKNFGRGTDFVCYDSALNAEGGVVVIQTFFSEDLSEEIQIRGRTGRQGQNGTYILYLNLQDLAKFNFNLEQYEKSSNYYQTLNEERIKCLLINERDILIGIEEKKTDHKQSQVLIDKIKESIAQNKILGPGDQKLLNEHLFGLNRGNLRQSEQKIMKLLILIDCTSSMGPTLQKTKNCLKTVIYNLKQHMNDNHLDENLLQIKIGGYRNYLSLEKKLYQASPSWTSDTNALCNFLSRTLDIYGGEGNEAIEIGLWHANQEIINDNGIPLSMIIIIGDAPPNTVEEVKMKRDRAASFQGIKTYWSKTKYKDETHWEKELIEIQKANVLVHAFYVLNMTTKKNEEEKKKVENEFKKLCVNDGKCEFLDIENNKIGQNQLQELLIRVSLHRAAEINYGKQVADEAVAKIKKQHT